MCHAMISLLHNSQWIDVAFRGRNASQERLRGRLELTVIVPQTGPSDLYNLRKFLSNSTRYFCKVSTYLQWGIKRNTFLMNFFSFLSFRVTWNFKIQRDFLFFYFQVSIHVVFKHILTFSTCVTTFTSSVMTDNINSWLATRPDELQQHHITLLSWHKTRVPDFCVKILIKQGERKKVGEIYYFMLTLGNGNLKIWTSIKITQL